MSVLNEFIAFLKDYNKLLEKGTKNIYDSTSYIWVNDILELTGQGGCSSVIPYFFKDPLDKVSQILKIDKPVKPVIEIPNSFTDVTFNEAKNVFECDSQETLDAFKGSIDGIKEQIKIDHFKLAKKIYSKLFTAYNDTKNDSSREATLSVALIQYSKSKEIKEIESVSKINQHLFHFPLKLDLAANNALTVSFTDEEKPFADFSFLNNTPIRKDALDNIIDSFEAGIETSGFKFIYETAFKNLISHTLQQIYVDSSFADNLNKPASDQTKLNTFEISFAPAINAKIKKPRFFEKLTDSILEYDKENKPEVPLINIILKDPNSNHNNTFVKSNYLTDIFFEETKEKYINLEKDDFSIFFPLPYNKEQKEIFEKYQKNRLTVVTGPPGTGKSHSIVNILCNLLAQGQRVLITAQTDKALESLLDKIPKQFDSLLFTKIKLPNSDRFSLEHSIDNLTEILTSEKIIDISEKISSLDRYKATYVELKGEVYSILDNEYRVFDLSEHFKGLKNHEIFKKLISVNEKEWNWIEDTITTEILSQAEEIIHSLKSLIAYSESNIEKLQSTFDIESFKKEFSEFDFDNYFDLHRRVKELKRELLLSASVTNEQILSLSVDAIRPLLIEYDNSDIVIKDPQTLHRLLNSFKRIEENGD
ncbi:MAG TPA: AAA domain-containing protein, partial [Chitinophagaceae bacterium]